ncbi:MAG TPA: crosslink repair DNA glycosylase YcaQ family protein [Jiangellaceae bacterium]|nr:crosslink repair DNA glycosylase YcaQ family protein [Jiangellaceae bacterium]
MLSPFDRLTHDRKRTIELFEFDYQLEMYKPAAQRRWGYFALPILYGDRLVGKLDAADHTAGVLRVYAIHQDTTFTKTMTAAVRRDQGPGSLAQTGPQVARFRTRPLARELPGSAGGQAPTETAAESLS